MSETKTGWGKWLELTKKNPIEGMRILGQATAEALGEEVIVKPLQSIARRVANGKEHLSSGIRQLREPLEKKAEEINQAYQKSQHTNALSEYFADPIIKDKVFD